MDIGKVPNSILKEIILNKIVSKRDEVLVRPNIGEDCCALDLNDNICVLSSDPITGAVNEVGRLAVHISCNDIASCGAEPVGLIVTIMAPPGTVKEELDYVMGQICDTAAGINVDIIGGHTEITSAVNRFVVVSTSVGKVLKDKLVTTSGARPGDDIILTKSAGIEGTAIIAYDKESELVDMLGAETVKKAKAFMNSISVVKEGIVAGKFGVNSMHDVTEGGVLGAVWEVCEASGVGAVIYKDKVPVEDETLKISDVYRIDPLKLISSGCMIITCESGEELVKEFGTYGLKAAVIGEVTLGSEKKLVMGDSIEIIGEPESDELYKVVW